MTLKIDAELEQNLICGFRNDKNFVKFDPSTRKSALDSLHQNLHFHLFLLCKVFNFWPEWVQRSYLSWLWRVMKKKFEEFDFEEKMTCGLENDMRNMAKFHQSTWKSQNWNFDGIVEKV